ncbi:hypothetical protein BDQ17DRAFT_1393914 [Cyathus striatus]|nr:hypothetical protein BDQ17DRAFT_1393914 [Cyathus striatus]
MNTTTDNNYLDRVMLQYAYGARRGAQCAKYFSQYSQQILTGGIMAVWCTHSICYGFHCIPTSEGCNDVFSALEDGFFANTDFVIDRFHTPGHTKCAPTCFLKTYATADLRLKANNSSAAKCGNAVLACIRKSVSYMGQYRATLYMKTFIPIYNQGIYWNI